MSVTKQLMGPIYFHNIFFYTMKVSYPPAEVPLISTKGQSFLVLYYCFTNYVSHKSLPGLNIV